ncbi:hypothetical protein HJD18_07300 [Thermoleophilia bacterium SCSIO 60948]|nr:hypothetical protein HJD18_07300 [Thermoleophilia bacterium SCSIO 60948]
MKWFERRARCAPAKLSASAIILLAGVATGPAVAAAGVTGNYASPNGSGADCTEQSPCDIRTAVDSAGFEEDVKLFPGSYELGSQSLAIDNQNDVSPVDPDASFGPPILRSSAPGFAVQVVGDDSSLRDAVIVSASTQASLLLTGSGTPRAERVAAINQGSFDTNTQQETGNGCNLQSGVLRDSLCWGNGTSPSGFSDGIEISGYSSTLGGTLRNVTAYSDQGSGIYLGAFGSDGSTVLDARNVIFQGGGSESDIQVFGDSGSTVEADIDYSNFDSVLDLAADSEVPAAGSASNQLAPPVFSEPANGDFRQAAGSPTIDAGTGAASELGMLDLDRHDRIQGQAIDIGAYETAGPPPDTTAPAVRITKGPAKRTTRRVATFRFTASDDAGDVIITCRLDGKPPRGCSSPKTYRNLKPGRHTFAVTASDEAGNTATKRYAWKVLKRKRRG